MDLQDKLDKFTKRFYRIRNLTEQICSLFSESENNLQIGYDVSPNKWQLGHTSWFFENFIIKSKTKKFYNQDYFFLFNSYYNSQGKYIDKSIRYTIDKPSLNEVLEYRNYVNKEIEKIIGKGLEKDTYFLIELGLQHEQQHQELILSDTKYSLFHSNNLEAKLNKRGPSPAKSKYSFYSVDEGLFEIGYDGKDFFYDVEQKRHKKYLDSFEISDRMITNGEFLEFIKDNSYDDSLLWHSDGWDWIKKNDVNSPEYWINKNGEWYVFDYDGVNKIDVNLPVSHINYYEAWAFAKWSGYRLPTEFEWEVACTKFADINTSNLLTYQIDKNGFKGDFNTESNQFFGFGWEWTESAFLPYPGYKQDQGALGEYNGKFMVNTMVLRGGCAYTPEDHIRSTYRNFYKPEKRWMLSGIRLAKNKD